MQRRRFTQTQSLEERLAEEAKRLREKAKSLPPGPLREDMLRKARQAENGSHMSEWLRSPGLQPVGVMEDMKASAEKMRAEADYAEQIARSATDLRKRELYERLAAHFRQLAGEIEKVIANRTE